MKNKKPLRQVYAENDAAREFLEKHPEFNDAFLEQVEQHSPYHQTVGGSYTLTEPRPDLVAAADAIQAGMRLLPKKKTRRVLELYYKGASLSTIMRVMGYKSNASTRQSLVNAKKRALAEITRTKKARIKDQTPKAVRFLSYKEQEKFLYLVYDEVTGDDVWVNEEGEALPLEIQAILDEHPDYKEWDEVYL